MSDVTRILQQMESGDPHAAAKLLPLVYDELRKLAASKIAHENPGQTLQATALVHEAYLRLVAAADTKVDDQPTHWDGRGHFFAAAAEAMRRILVENARRKKQVKRGGQMQRHELHESVTVKSVVHEDLIALDAALDRLKNVDPQALELVHMRYFAGLSIPEAAKMLRISPRTADRLWSFARAWLRCEIAGTETVSDEAK
jgi:RNA polymerase sigma factor (TIGR02999 family)